MGWALLGLVLLALVVVVWISAQGAKAVTRGAPGRCPECGKGLTRTGLGYAAVCHHCGHRRADKI